MLAASRREALTDALTGLGNRRALMRDLEHAAADATADRAGARALRPRRLQALQRHLRPRRRRRAAARASGADLAAAVGGRGAPTAWAATSSACCSPARRRADEPVVDAPRPLAEPATASRSTRSYGVVVAARRGRTTPARRCASPTSACTRSSTAAAPRPSSQSRDVLLRALGERDPELRRPHRRRRRARARRSAAPGPRRRGARRRAPRRRAARHRQGRDPRRDPATSPARSTRPSGSSSASTRSSASASSAPRRRCAPSAASCAPATSAGTAAATPTAWPATDIPLGARIVVGLRRLRRDDRRPRLPQRAWPQPRRSPSCERCAGTQFDPAVVAAFKTATARGRDARRSRAA